MTYRSTSGQAPPVSFREACFRGLAPDGGLYVPEWIPRLETTDPGAPFVEIAAAVLSRFVTDIPAEALRRIIRTAINFEIPLTRFGEGIDLLELFHGPTLAFKDVGARFMAGMLAHYLREERRELTIGVATSGDTGSAVAQGFFEVPGIRVYVLYPSGRVSTLQEQQMATLGGNIHALEVEGSFDDCQRILKQALADGELVRRTSLTTANSINVGRLLPQIAYYVWACAEWRTLHGAAVPRAVVVPSGNLGNLTAAAYAQQMGVPLGALVAATNRNRVFTDYIEHDRFEPRPSVQTLSNAMDVGNPSNVARLQHLYGAVMPADMKAVEISDEETLEEIAAVHARSGVFIDPHTAVGLAAVRRLGLSGGVIVAATAHPAKFPDTIERATGRRPALPPALQRVLRLPKKSVQLPASVEAFREVLLEGR